MKHPGVPHPLPVAEMEISLIDLGRAVIMKGTFLRVE
jgi:hypothetical protein